MAGQPLCPVVLSMLSAGPRRPHEVARALASSYPAARTTLHRLRDGGLVRERAAPAGPVYVITRRGRGELALQRLLCRLSARA
jgi:DNA-binding PadR family transcriptional regulator